MEVSQKHTSAWRYRRSVTMTTSIAFFVLFSVCIPITRAVYPRRGFPDLPGNYCRYKQPSECCNGRIDECSVPIRDTLCYCDQFCDRDYNPDCCPDYWNVCKGIQPPNGCNKTQPTCYKDGIHINSGQSYKFNCNLCECIAGQLRCEDDPCMIDEQIIDEVNLAPRYYGWRATNYSDYWGRKAKEGLVLKTGTLLPEDRSLNMYPILLQPNVSLIPREFDARRKREWQGRVSDVSDQGWCGASWAFSTLGVAQDRLSIQSYDNETVRLSFQNLISCNRLGQNGCKGGHVDRAWLYLRRIGVVNEECYEYESGSTGKVPVCPILRRANLFNLRCPTKEVVFRRGELYKTEPAYRISRKEEDIQWEILKNGPVQAMMKIHRDLFMYSSGVYSNSGLGGDQTGFHSVRILGWGEDTNQGGYPVKYWLVANSWGRQWGENGLFRVKRGSNESGIEDFIIAVRARQYRQYRKPTPCDIAQRRTSWRRVRPNVDMMVEIP